MEDKTDNVKVYIDPDDILRNRFDCAPDASVEYLVTPRFSVGWARNDLVVDNRHLHIWITGVHLDDLGKLGEEIKRRYGPSVEVPSYVTEWATCISIDLPFGLDPTFPRDEVHTDRTKLE